ncbi:hypothetical protein OF83DRAFT_1109968 [Amylostereum chailletii]|nr:hypothetical protein OF83DRAFT_1109968 [Amylostereum chailletii]
MSASGPTMKTFQKRLYTVLPRGVAPAAAQNSQVRVRSNSASSSRSLYTAPSSSSSLSGIPFFDASPQPSPSSRPGNSHVLSSTRLPIEGKAELEAPTSPTHQSSHSHPGGPAPPSSIALTSPYSNGYSALHGLPNSTHSAPFFPYPPFNPPTAPNPSASIDSHASQAHTSKRTGKHKYHFDVGAYGIPKRSRSVVSGRDGHGSAGIWSSAPNSHSSAVTDALDLAVQVGEDAYFVRENAMGVADGVGGWSRSRSSPLGPSDPSPSALFARRLMHYCSAEVASLCSCPPPSAAAAPTFSFHEPPLPHVPFFPSPSFTSWNQPLSKDQGLSAVDEEDDDAFDMDELQEGLDVLLILERAYARTLEAHVVPAPATPPAAQSRSSTPPHTFPPQHKPDTVPLLTGSSTALLAVLDHAGSGPHPHPTPEVSEASPTEAAGCDAVIRIAHLGDCMGMLVRGEEIVWRSDEMWWSFNTPLQLGPSSRTPPSSAQLLTLPVRADDILILASDGLSDNLWDEDVLDEVVRFRRALLTSTAHSASQAPGLLGRRTLAGMLSEALCSRARKVSEVRASKPLSPDEEIPFARRAREEGKSFNGGKTDDISVLVAVISPAEDTQPVVAPAKSPI